VSAMTSPACTTATQLVFTNIGDALRVDLHKSDVRTPPSARNCSFGSNMAVRAGQVVALKSVSPFDRTFRASKLLIRSQHDDGVALGATEAAIELITFGNWKRRPRVEACLCGAPRHARGENPQPRPSGNNRIAAPVWWPRWPERQRPGRLPVTWQPDNAWGGEERRSPGPVR
jgi:hypothetical protein